MCEEGREQDGAGGREGGREGDSALAACGHPLLVDSSSHMAAAAVAGSQDP